MNLPEIHNGSSGTGTGTRPFERVARVFFSSHLFDRNLKVRGDGC